MSLVVPDIHGFHAHRTYLRQRVSVGLYNMKNIYLTALIVLLLVTVTLVFLFSCVATLSDGQGALIFIFSIPVMLVLLVCSWYLARKIMEPKKSKIRIEIVLKIFSFLLASFFITAFIPGLRLIPNAFLGVIGKSFESVTGKTPYAYFRERNSFPNLLSRNIGDSTKKEIDLSTLGVSFAWDKVCIFGPYTDNSKAKSILNLDWNIETRSKIKESDSINALVFLFEGKVNQVVDLKRSIADFESVGRCLDRSETRFSVVKVNNGRVVLR